MSDARYKTRQGIDMGRVAEGLKGPGIDTRTWFSMARVDEDPDATVWDSELGWLVDVTLVGGPLDGDGPVVCRLPTGGQGDGKGQYEPPRQGGLVVVAIPGGDTNSDCIIIGQVHDQGLKAAAAINGTSITEEFAARTHIHCFPDEDFDASFDKVRLTSQGAMVLGAADAGQAFARGDDLADKLGALADAISAFLDAAVTPAGTFGNVGLGSFAAAGAQLKVALGKFKASRTQYLSTKIRGV